jgi:hypothetical protein
MPHNESRAIRQEAVRQPQWKTIDRLITICKVLGMTDSETEKYVTTGKVPDRLRSDA